MYPQRVDMIFPAAMTSLQMEEHRVHITLGEKSDVASLQQSQTQSAQLSFPPQGKLLRSQGGVGPGHNQSHIPTPLQWQAAA